MPEYCGLRTADLALRTADCSLPTFLSLLKKLFLWSSFVLADLIRWWFFSDTSAQQTTTLAMKDIEKEELIQLIAAPYIQKATALIGVARKVGGNQFRHMMATFTILLDYHYTNHVLLKASLIHDLFEDVPEQSRGDQAARQRWRCGGAAGGRGNALAPREQDRLSGAHQAAWIA